MKLLEPIRVGHTVFKNRVMFPPLTTGYEDRDGTIGEQSLNFYKRLAEGGVGYIVIGDVVPIPTISPTPKLFMDSQIPSFKALADTLHKYDCKLGLQIFHPEYDAAALMQLFKEGKQQEGFAKLHYDMLHYVNEATHEQLEVILSNITACVKRAIEANVDVIEVHGDRLIGSLCSTIINRRTDEYGGSFENRIRFALQVVDAIKSASDKVTIEYKLPIVTRQKDGTFLGKGGLILEEAIEFAKILERQGVHSIHVAQANHTGNMNDTIPAMGTRPYAFMLEECKAIKKAVSIPISIVGRIVDVSVAENLLQQDVCDIVAFGRSLLADPDIVQKVMNNKTQTIRHCIMCNKGCTDAIQSRKFLSCVLNPENGYEYKRTISPAQTIHKIAIVGAGIAGLEAARVASLKGHKVTVYEKTSKPYGQINIASVPPRKSEMLRICNYYDQMIKELNIQIVYQHEFQAKDAEGYDDIIVAVGASNAHPPISGIEYTIDAWDVLAGRRLPVGKVVVAGGGLVGVETAEYLAEMGYSVTIVEMMDKIAKEESNTILPTILKQFESHNVEVLTSHRIESFSVNGVSTVETNVDGTAKKNHFIRADVIINALASKKNTLNLENIKAKIHYVGDCLLEAPCNVDQALKSAYDVANAIGEKK